MYQTEANFATEPVEQLPIQFRSSFSELQGKIVSRTALPWGEHCTECVWPTCYSSCDLYSPRLDGGCRRFADGMVRLEYPEAINGYLLKIRFKQWGKLWTPGNTHLMPAGTARRREDRDHLISSVLHQLPLPSAMTGTLVQKRYSFKKQLALRSGLPGLPTSLILECYNPAEQTVSLSLTLRSSRLGQSIPFQKLISVSPGFRRIRIPTTEISQLVNLALPFSLEILPAEAAEDTTLYFGLMDFVRETEPVQETEAPIKCVVWDLDNTLWDGILTEQGSCGLKLKPRMAQILQALDSRGILQSIASKNDHDEAMKAVAGLQLDSFFLYPQISWEPKSNAIRSIAQQLNIGMDSILFVDDSEFELEEVRSTCPGVRCLNSRDYDTILDLKACTTAVTEESSGRRLLYQVEQNRKQIAASFKDDYKAFIRHCEIKLRIVSLDKSNLERVHELTQRTNQMNFSGTRYSRDVLNGMLTDVATDTFVLSCEDRFGTYGVVGFAVVDRREPRLTDLMFSCRIQSKRVEHAFLGYILSSYREQPGTDFHANYRKTLRNAPSGKVFADLGFLETDLTDGVTSLLFPHTSPVPNDGIITIEAQPRTSNSGQLV